LFCALFQSFELDTPANGERYIGGDFAATGAGTITTAATVATGFRSQLKSPLLVAVAALVTTTSVGVGTVCS
jgi:hypothetical protein